MKVERKNGFQPIVITLETYEEACEMWHRLNEGFVKIKDNHDSTYEFPGDSNDLWRKMNAVFKPEIK